MSLFASLATMLRSSPSGGARRFDAPTERSLLQRLHDVLDELPGLLSDRVTLLSLELRRASRAFAQLAVLVLLAALLGATAWFLAWAGITAALVQAGLHWGWAIAIAVAVNLICAAIALRRAIALGPLLALPATLRHLTLAPKRGRANGDAGDDLNGEPSPRPGSWS